MVNLGRSVHCVCVGGGAQPGLVVLRGLKQQAEQAKKHERPPPISALVSASGSCLELLRRFPSIAD